MIKFSIVQRLNKLLLAHSNIPETIINRARETNLQAISKKILEHDAYFFDKETEIGQEIMIENSINVISDEELFYLKTLVHDLRLNYDYTEANSQTLKQINEILNP